MAPQAEKSSIIHEDCLLHQAAQHIKNGHKRTTKGGSTFGPPLRTWEAATSIIMRQ